MNIVLIGFKSSGKTSLGQELARLRKMSFVDTDQAMEEFNLAQTGQFLTCRELYQNLGEDEFRYLEKDVLMELAVRDNQLIATGGGIVMSPVNRKLLRMTGFCIFLDTPLALLEQRLANNQSPLFSDLSPADLHSQRYPLYLNTAHLRFPVRQGDSPEQAALALNQILEELDFGQ